MQRLTIFLQRLTIFLQRLTIFLQRLTSFLQRLTIFLQRHYHRHRHGSGGWILKGDISTYYYNISHRILKEDLYRHLREEKLIGLLHRIIDSTNEPNLQANMAALAAPHGLSVIPILKPGRGLPLGSMTSQWFALYYLYPLDRFIKETLKISHYSRYMDDFVLIHHDRACLKDCLNQLGALLKDRLELTLNHKTQLFPLRNGVDYLGFHTYLTETGRVIRKLSRNSKQRMKRKIRKFKTLYAAGQLDLTDVRQSMVGRLGHARHGHTYHFRAALLQSRR